MEVEVSKVYYEMYLRPARRMRPSLWGLVLTSDLKSTLSYINTLTVVQTVFLGARESRNLMADGQNIK